MVCRAGCRTVSFEIACRHKRYNGNAAGIGGRSDAATGTARVPAYADNRQGDYPGIEIRPSGGETVFAAGRSYMVTLKFRDRTAVALSAKVMPWVMDGYGEGIVE